ncbi:shikimate dehydrogenase [Lewinella marina]|uniref:Shikimate dehydrogenase n=1 Tax=Neolewinella marina TaxID=438751 RepID=A0A2G0CIG1_9BACT|nr:shikimate dehydrogenase [Neolewinella marina]NJB85167.1 shikimate dehydrogenase [Neolewinella marina]PHK99700.1 shikimate dehydrogenase [Neolewinella marina]
MPTFGLLGYPLSHSFSRGYFTAKFADLGLSDTHRYLNFEIPTLEDFQKILDEYPDLRGLNVTIPHKQGVVALLDAIDPAAERIGAVNTILIEDGKTRGFNTDYLGFRDDLLAQLRSQQRFTNLRGQSALILGSGGAALAVREALLDLSVKPVTVSRSARAGQLSYADLDRDTLTTHRLIVNTTPLGMYPQVETAPEIPYELLTPAHFCYDLIYNPAETRFMRLARGAGAGAANGMGMLHSQAEAAWNIWTAE